MYCLNVQPDGHANIFNILFEENTLWHFFQIENIPNITNFPTEKLCKCPDMVIFESFEAISGAFPRFFL